MRKLSMILIIVLMVVSGLTGAFASKTEEKTATKEEAPAPMAESEEKMVSLEIPSLPPWEIYNLTDWEKKSGNKITKFNEAPMLQEMVAAGQIPKVEERLPKEPLVVKPTEGIGTYGGTLTFVGIHMLEGGEFTHIVDSNAFTRPQRGGAKDLPYAMKAFEISDGGRTYTFSMREGLKWSDGQPVTADDVVFFFEDLAYGPEELRALEWGAESGYGIGGNDPKVIKVNDYEVRIEYPVPHPHFMDLFNQNTMQSGMRPKHALSKYHITYNKDANELAKKYGFDTWVQLIALYARMPYQGPEELNIERPVLGPWMFKEQLADGMIFERNPYYFQIDTDGNQLPYMDEVKVISVENVEMVKAKALSGEADFVNWGLPLATYPLFAEEAQKGKFRIMLTKGSYMSNTTFWFNLDYDADPQVGALLANKKFRQALSLATDRDDINESLYFGKGTPIQHTVGMTVPYFKEEWGRAYAEYDPAKANEMLDELGLNWDSDHKFRQYEDGITVSVEVVTMTNHMPDYVPTLEIARENWRDIGINVNVKPVTKKYQGQYGKANKFQIRSRMSGYFSNTYSIVERRAREAGPKKVAPRWFEWVSSGGEKGVEPPEYYKDWVLKTYSLPDIGDREELVKTIIEIFDFNAEEVFGIGTVGYIPSPAVFNNDLGNVPTDMYAASTFMGFVPYRPQDWYWKK